MKLGWCLDNASPELHFPAHTQRSASCFFPYLTELMQKSVLSLFPWLTSVLLLEAAVETSLMDDCTAQYCHLPSLEQTVTLCSSKSKLHYPGRNCIMRTSKGNTRRETMRASRNANGPPKRSYQPEGWVEEKPTPFCLPKF